MKTNLKGPDYYFGDSRKYDGFGGGNIFYYILYYLKYYILQQYYFIEYWLILFFFISMGDWKVGYHNNEK